MPLHDLPSTSSHLLGVSFTTSVKSICTQRITTQNTAENNCAISHAQNTTALQPHVFSKLKYIGYWSHSKQSDFPSAN